MTVAVLDIGKSNVKLVLLDESGGTIAVRSRPNVVRPGPPYPHFDTDGIEAWLIAALASLPRRDDIAAIVPVAHGCAAALLAGETLVLPVLDYEHDGPDETAAAFDAAADPFARSFTPPLPFGLLVGRQLFWLARRFPDAFARTSAILPNPQFWAWRLCGVAATEVTSLGSHTGLWQPQARDWADIVRREGWLALMPPMRAAWDTLGPLRPGIAAATGLDPACLAHRATRAPPFAVISTGTWTIVMAAGAALARLDPARDMLANVDVFGDPVPTARFMGGREFAAVAGEAASTAATLDDAARVMARGTLVRPAFVPGSGPFAGHQGAILGSPPQTAAERVALADLYLALAVDVMLDLLGAHPPFIVEGPSAAAPVFLAALAALRPGAPVIASEDGTGTGAGALILAQWGRGAPRQEAGRGADAGLLPGMAPYRARWRALL
jgi:L-fuculokinase